MLREQRLRPFLQRQKALEALSTEFFDVLVVGGGITGAGIALDAASRGLRVALVEKGDFASGTSSRSTKLVHGGLRYLKNLELGLVRSTGRERSVNHRMAPLRVYPEKMLIPLRRGGLLHPLSARLAISLYDLLAGVEKKERLRMLRAEQTLALLPQLRPDQLLGGALYTEYQTDDSRLTIEILKTARDFGALLFNYLEAVAAVLNAQGRLEGYRLRCNLTGAEVQVAAAVVVAAVGPWADLLRRRRGLHENILQLSRGIHVVVSAAKLPLSVPVYMDVLADKGRMVFCIPRRGHVYIGTTDNYFEGDPDFPDIPEEEIEYLLQAVNDQFNLSHPLQKEDVKSAWTGLRPLLRRPGKKSTELSRRDEILELPDGMLLITGGKLTGWRLMAQKTVDRCSKVLKKRFGKKVVACRTAQITLRDVGPGEPATPDLWKEMVRGWAAQLPDGPDRSEEIAENYGRAAEKIVQRAYEIYQNDRSHGSPLLQAEVEWTIQEEWAWRPEDYFLRRSGKAFFNPEAVIKEEVLVAELFRKIFSQTTPSKAN